MMLTFDLLEIYFLKGILKNHVHKNDQPEKKMPLATTIAGVTITEL